jgi:Relaxase/Mobilisation nuclease domain
VVYDLAQAMNFEQHQYLAVSHLDTAHQHVHLVVNRVGYDGKTLKDHHNYRRMAAACRKLEIKYGLRQVPSPKRFLPLGQRMLLRQDVRKETLRQHVEQALASTKTLEDFYAQMKACGYQVLRGRGLSFLDDKGVKIKGSEVGYPLAKIEGVLGQKRELRQGQGSRQQRSETGYETGARDLQQGRGQGERQHFSKKQNEAAKTVEQLMKPVPMQEPVNPQLLQKKRQRSRRSQHL